MDKIEEYDLNEFRAWLMSHKVQEETEHISDKPNDKENKIKVIHDKPFKKISMQTVRGTAIIDIINPETDKTKILYDPNDPTLFNK